MTKVGDEWVPVNRQSDDSWYSPTVKKGKPDRKAPVNVSAPSSVYGIGKPTTPIINNHLWTGDAMRVGDIRIDAHNLAGEDLGKTARATVALSGWQEAWDAAAETRTSPEQVAIRDINELPDDLRKSAQAFFEGKLSTDDLEALPDDLQRVIYPADEEIPAHAHVRYIDPRMLGNLYVSTWDHRWRAMEPGMRAVFAPINNLARPFMLYGPKYSLNLLGNAGMLVFDQGFLNSGENIARALSLNDLYGDENAGAIRQMVGAGKASGYISGELSTKGAAVSRALANFWSRFTDNDIRVASFLYYADRAGYRTPEQMHTLVNDPAAKDVRNDVTKRAEDALVAFDRMSPFEKATLRHIIFVYPWQRGALVWSFRSVFEHPAKTALLATLGQEAYTHDKWLSAAPGWVRRAGYIPFHWVGDKLGLVDPTSVNTFSTLAQIGATLKGEVQGDQYASMGDWLGQSAQILSHTASGVDANGNPYKGSALLGAVEDVFSGVPLVAAYHRNQKGQGKPLAPLDITNREALMTELNSALKQVVLDPGWLDGFGSQLAGGFSPRELNLTPAAARYWAAATPEAKHQHEIDLIMRTLAIQAQFVKSGYPDQATVSRMLVAPLNSITVKGQVPEDVRKAVLDAGQLAYLSKRSNAAYVKTHGVNMTAKQLLVQKIGYYRDAGRISGTVAKELRTHAVSLESQPDINHMSAALSVKYGHAKALALWNSDVSTLAQFSAQANPNAKANTDVRIAFLHQNGLAETPTVALSDTQREQYGRGYVSYLRGRRAAVDGLTGAVKTDALLAYDDAHAEPVEVGGQTLPSYAALRLSDGPSDVAQQQIIRAAGKPWGSLSTVEKQALGRKTDQTVADGWDLFRRSVKATRDANGSVTSQDRKAIAQYVSKYYPAFAGDYQYASLPKVERFQASAAYKQMPQRAAFDDIAANARAAATAMTNGSPNRRHTLGVEEVHQRDESRNPRQLRRVRAVRRIGRRRNPRARLAAAPCACDLGAYDRRRETGCTRRDALIRVHPAEGFVVGPPGRGERTVDLAGRVELVEDGRRQPIPKSLGPRVFHRDQNLGELSSVELRDLGLGSFVEGEVHREPLCRGGTLVMMICPPVSI